MGSQDRPSDGGSRLQRQLAGGSPRTQGLQLNPEEKKPEPPAKKSAGLQNYEATLGKWLGGKLYGALSKELTLDKMAGHAESGIKSALGSFGDYIKEADGDVDPAQVDKAIAALKGALGKEAKGFVKAHGAGLTSALKGFADANPELIVLIALLAAAGAVAANMKIPELKTKLGITDGLDLELSAKLGKFQNLALEKLQAKLTLTAGTLKATALVAYDDEEMKAKLGLKYGLRPGLDLSATGSWGEDEGFGARLGLDYKPTDGVKIGAHVGYDEDKGANAGVGVTINF